MARTKARIYSSQIVVQLSLSKVNSLSSTERNLFGRPMAYNTSPILDKETCTDYVDFGKCRDKNRIPLLKFLYLGSFPSD